MYIADLHIHSRYSRATSRDLTPEQLDFQAFGKGIRLLGTGDFTHPAWREELKEKLIPAEDGLYCLREEYRLNSGRISEEARTRFVVSGEISSIYKQDGKVRKVHSLILLPGLEEAEKLAGKLETIGNIHSDGRPILGLSCHDLLEIMLEVCPEGMFIPAHIWTPHFSMFGAFSGFDRVEECFGELAPYIHAVETGLSSDPPMNWRLSVLDRYQLLSNSDAHSPAKLGREANLLTGELSYEGLKKAVETGEGLAGTIEFFPEEGKYHYDGHRKCHISMSPGEAEACGGVCPVCKKKLTMGVSHRISQLADRPEGFVPERAKPFESLVPLLEVIGASTGRSAAGKRVQELYRNMIESLGNEFSILREVPLEDIRHGFGTRIAEGIRRLRTGQVKRLPGFDGEYGIIRLFDAGELENTDGQLSMKGLLELENREKRKNRTAGEAVALKENGEAGGTVALEENGEGGKHAASEKGGQEEDFLDRLNENQRQAAEMPARSLAVIAGPGTGKTGTLTARIRC
ncbi:MAG: UvrD-helicase domain-containing protein, partial [Clostridium sp.]